MGGIEAGFTEEDPLATVKVGRPAEILEGGRAGGEHGACLEGTLRVVLLRLDADTIDADGAVADRRRTAGGPDGRRPGRAVERSAREVVGEGGDQAEAAVHADG